MSSVVEANRRAFRARTARRALPELLLWAGAVFVTYGLSDLVVFNMDSAELDLVFLGLGLICLAEAFVLRLPRVPSTAAPWAWALTGAALAAILLFDYTSYPEGVTLGFIAITITAFGPINTAWWPFAVSNTCVLAITYVIFSSDRVDVVAPFGLIAAAVGASAILLRLRIKTLDQVADAQAEIARQATTDPMTGMLNRNGVDQLMPSVTARAQRTGNHLLVWFVDVRGLKSANDSYGHEFGDALISAVARALTQSVRADDVTARWGGDEFVAIGVGTEGSAGVLNERIDSLLLGDDTLHATFPARVTVGFAVGDASSDIHAVISAADANMYARRNQG